MLPLHPTPRLVPVRDVLPLPLPLPSTLLGRIMVLSIFGSLLLLLLSLAYLFWNRKPFRDRKASISLAPHMLHSMDCLKIATAEESDEFGLEVLINPPEALIEYKPTRSVSFSSGD